ncbi:sarcosine oxidase subunit gamma [Aestuariibius sp. HNIBRBA575]|uniref:sarcosine oxidase subunit gamma n=1 Tax=Aestuariibius sp. HNIBRBA575 TaxID=3233343 RepID=UPI0034A5A2B6
MIELKPISALSDWSAKTIGQVSLSEVVPKRITSLAPFRGQDTVISEWLMEKIGVPFPTPNTAPNHGRVRAMWLGPGQALIFEAKLPPTPLAAMTDQTGAWAVIRLQGAQVEQVLARLIPVDLRQSAMPINTTARTLIGHMTGSVTRVDVDTFDVMVMRSMATTLCKELEHAATGIAGRG